MSKPKHKWYGSVKKQIMDRAWENPNSFQDFLMQKAMYEATQKTLKLPNGEDRMDAVEKILIQQEKNYDGVAMEMYTSRPTIERWITSFVNMVGKEAGY